MRVEQVFITPLVSGSVYGVEVDVSAFIRIDGLSKIKRSIDSTDYGLGVYRFEDMRLKCENALGTFNENDSRSIFTFTRDKAKVRIVALKITFSLLSQSFTFDAETQFDGLINDEATRQNITNDVVTMVALSKDSVFRTTRVPAGIITAGTSVKNALFQILSQPSITGLLTVDILNINPDLNYIIDTPEELDNLDVREALNLLIRAANSVLILKSDVIFIQSRENPSPPATLELRGRGEVTNNANIISISEYNSGKQRQFNSARLNDGLVTVEDTDSISEYGLRQLKLDFPMVTNTDTLREIGETIAIEFRYPKIELKLRVPTEVSEGSELLDLVSVDAPWLRKHLSGDFLPIYNVSKYNDASSPYPQVTGSLQIDKAWKFKIISIEDDPKTFITILKLRQAGKLFGDGVF